MDNNQVHWLDHLKDAVLPEGYGNKLSMYLIALEAWRRGIGITFYTIDNPENKLLIRYSLSYNGETYHFESSRGNKISDEAYNICENKDRTKEALSAVDVKVPKGKKFTEDQESILPLEFADEIGYPVVIKPLSENAGKGVFSYIRDSKQLEGLIGHLTKELRYDSYLIEEHIEGPEYRILIVNGKIVGAVNRLPANIVGNGKNTIEELINIKNQSKRNNPTMAKKRIDIDKEVLNNININGYELSSILNSNDTLYLRNKTNVSAGGDPIDVTDTLSEEMYSIVEKTAQAIPNMGIGGMDVIIDDKTGEKYVIEINTKPMIGLHVFPKEGIARDVVKEIIDFYFPETEDLNKSKFYFDFNSMIAPLNNITTTHVNVDGLKSRDFYSRRFIIQTSNNQSKSSLRLIALRNAVHGYVSDLKKDEIEAIVASEMEQNIVDFEKDINKTLTDSKIEEIESWNKPVPIDFSIIKENQNDKLERKIHNLKGDKETLSNQVNKLQSDLESKKNNTKKLKEERNNLLSEIEWLQTDKRHIKNAYEKVKKQQENLKVENTKISKEKDEFKKAYLRITNSKPWRLIRPIRVARRKILDKQKGR